MRSCDGKKNAKQNDRPSPSPTDRAWQERYEALRAHALGETPVDFVPLGLGVLRLHGMAAWLAVQRSTATTACTSMEISTTGTEQPDERTAEWDKMKRELVRLLAGTALSVTMRSSP